MNYDFTWITRWELVGARHEPHKADFVMLRVVLTFQHTRNPFSANEGGKISIKLVRLPDQP